MGQDDPAGKPLDLPVGICTRRKQSKPRRLNDHMTRSDEHPIHIHRANSALNRTDKLCKVEEKSKHSDCLVRQRSVRTKKINKRYSPEVDREEESGKRKTVKKAESKRKYGQLLMSLKRDKKMEESQVEYAVQDVLAVRVDGAARTFLIRWEGFGPEADTWEPESSVGKLDIVKDAIRQVEEKKQKASDGKNSSVMKKRHDIRHETGTSTLVNHPRPTLTWNGLTIIKGNWTEEEDQRLTQLVTHFLDVNPGMAMTRWAEIAKQLPGRVGKQCRERWNNHLQPDVNKGSWTVVEEVMIYLCWCNWSNQWAKMARLLRDRTDNRIKNHWNCHMKRNLIGNSSYFQFMEDCYKNLNCFFNKNLSREDESKDNFFRENLLAAIRHFLQERNDHLEQSLFPSSLKRNQLSIPEESTVRQVEGRWIFRQMKYKAS